MLALHCSGPSEGLEGKRTWSLPSGAFPPAEGCADPEAVREDEVWTLNLSCRFRRRVRLLAGSEGALSQGHFSPYLAWTWGWAV